ncbi:hypothetical protein KN1_11240 [Stygiolobus caldivivus]|uniref:Uncharacterized protein n=1 Tax=Stygiolobus caldivivus TaxID=2824673 RepID=A0A8D5ZJ40_9CREN|nr:hypothetical protein KN1_11240 [Stygiolobus caldivivus]
MGLRDSYIPFRLMGFLTTSSHSTGPYPISYSTFFNKQDVKHKNFISITEYFVLLRKSRITADSA